MDTLLQAVGFSSWSGIDIQGKGNQKFLTQAGLFGKNAVMSKYFKIFHMNLVIT